jgi:hypothetical protein
VSTKPKNGRANRHDGLACGREVHWSLARRRYNLAEWWHLLSLDAPTVAALWSWFFARAMHLRFPLVASLLLALGTWLLYVADRILDGVRHRSGEPLQERHRFHARHRTAFLVAASLLIMLLTWFVLTHVQSEVLWDDAWIGTFAVLYLLVVHRRSVSPHPKALRLPKEVAVAVLFATATAVPAWSRLKASDGAGLGKSQLGPAVVCFAALCWVNCVGIEKWEAGCPPALANAKPHASTRWAGLHLRPIVTMIALFSLAAALLAPSRGLMAVYLAALLSSGLLFALDIRSSRFSPLHVRIAADAALLTPLAFFTIAR